MPIGADCDRWLCNLRSQTISGVTSLRLSQQFACLSTFRVQPRETATAVSCFLNSPSRHLRHGGEEPWLSRPPCAANAASCRTRDPPHGTNSLCLRLRCHPRTAAVSCDVQLPLACRCLWSFVATETPVLPGDGLQYAVRLVVRHLDSMPWTCAGLPCGRHCEGGMGFRRKPKEGVDCGVLPKRVFVIF